MNRRKSMYVLVAAAAMLGGCGAGPSDGEFVQACLKQQEQGIQMVKVTQEMCQCAAKYSRENLEPRLRQAMVLNMQGKKQESEALVANLSFDERAKFAMQQFEVIGACVVQRE